MLSGGKPTGTVPMYSFCIAIYDNDTVNVRVGDVNEVRVPIDADTVAPLALGRVRNCRDLTVCLDVEHRDFAVAFPDSVNLACPVVHGGLDRCATRVSVRDGTIAQVNVACDDRIRRAIDDRSPSPAS